MIKRTLLLLLIPALLVPVSVNAQTSAEKEYPGDLLAAMDSLTVLLNKNCSKSNAGRCFNPAESDESPDGVNFNPADIQRKLNELESGIPLDYNKHVQSFINLYGVKKRQLTERILTLSEFYFPMFEAVLDQQGLPQEFKYLAVIESALNPQAQSWAGACGLWQFIHSTGLAYNLKINSMVDERKDPMKATLAACQYFKNSYELYGDWLLVIASYNCGPGNVNKAIRRSGGKRNFWQIMPYLPRETRGYVPAFIAVAYVMNYASDLGIQPAEFDVHSLVEDVTIDQKVHFGQISQVLGIPMEDLVYLNPEYRKQMIPASSSDVHSITLPYSYAMRFAELRDSIYATPYTEFASADEFETVSKRTTHKVRRGESLHSIARKYGVTTSDLKAWNVIKGNTVKPGKKLVVYVRQKKEKKVEEPVVAKSETKDTAATAATALSDTLIVKSPTRQVTTKEKKKVATPVYHKVVAGDTLYGISKKYPGLTVEKLRAYNQLPKNAVIRPGTKLKVSPSGG